MAFYDWYKKKFGPKTKKEKVDALADIRAVIEFLELADRDINKIIPDLERLEELEKERIVGKKAIMESNLKAQAEVLDFVLERYGFFQNDVDINGLRVKRVSQEFLKNCKKAEQEELATRKKDKWQYPW